ncbi:unnamed protein product, partial [Gulo gulo]
MWGPPWPGHLHLLQTGPPHPRGAAGARWAGGLPALSAEAAPQPHPAGNSQRYTEQQNPRFPSPMTNCPMALLVLAEKTGFPLGKKPEFSVPDLAPVKGRRGSLNPPEPLPPPCGPGRQGEDRSEHGVPR